MAAEGIQSTVLITGAMRGLGRVMAQQYAAAGWRVIACGRAMTPAAEDGIVPETLDVADPASILDLARRLDGMPIDVLINNAGVFEANPVDRPHDDWVAEWERTMRINLTASAELCRLAVAHFQERGAGGRIVNIASRAAYRGDNPAHWHYAASKAGMVAMTKTIARAYAKDGILAFAICPGFTMTGMADDYLASRGGDKLLADIPLGRVAMPEEVGEMVRWLAADAPASMTGAVLDVNGASYVR